MKKFSLTVNGVALRSDCADDTLFAYVRRLFCSCRVTFNKKSKNRTVLGVDRYSLTNDAHYDNLCSFRPKQDDAMGSVYSFSKNNVLRCAISICIEQRTLLEKTPVIYQDIRFE